MTSFVHLHVRSEFSLKDSIVRIPALIDASLKAGMPSVAITDVMNFYGLVKLHNTAKDKGIKPVFGADLVISGGEGIETVTALVMNDDGYKNLIQLISRGYTDGQHLGEVTLQREWVDELGEGLILLLGRQSNVGQSVLNGDMALAASQLQQWIHTFTDRVYLEITRTGRDGEEDFLHAAVELAASLQCPVVATNDVRFIEPEDFEAHEARVCIAQSYVLDDPRRSKDYSPEQYLKTPEQMAELFSDIPEALENTIEIARRCSLSLSLGKNYLPDYEGKRGKELDDYFVQYSREKLEERLSVLLDPAAADYQEKRRVYTDRLEFELDTILKMGFAGYFLIVMDFIRWAKANGVPVGPGRGSGAGSLVAYALQITDLDPLPYDLLFERFLNPERVSMPDFDVDFCMEGRDRVIAYVAEKYGRESVSQIITFGTMAAKAVVRDVARVQGKPYGLADRISKMIPPTPGISLKEAREQEPQLNELLSNPEVSDHESALEIWEMALKLEGITRGVGKHAGGVLIAPKKLTEFTAIFCDEEGRWVSQYDKDDVEKVGLVKFDFLGLRTLTIIDWALKDINAKRKACGEEPLDIMAIPLNDPKTFKLLVDALTTAVFQLESSGMKKLLKDLRPSCFEDLIALVALFRPGPLESGMVTDFCNRKHGIAAVAYPDAQYQHECLEPILKPTYGVIVYQEQVMQIAQTMAGYTLGGADMLRRAMGKKKKEEMDKEKAKFVAGAEAKSIDKNLADKIFDLMAHFAGYGFNKSHSAAYALVSYQTAWLKVHYPSEFMAAVLSSEMHNTDKIVTFIEECRQMKLRIALPDVNHSQFKFVTHDDGTIVYGLGAIKGVGEGPTESIVEARNQGGAFKDLFDFCCRVDLRKCNKRTLEALVRSGAMDSLGPDRAVVMASLDEAVAVAEQLSRNAESGMVDLFGEVVEAAPSGSFVEATPWTDDERLMAEKETLGLFLTGHPIDQYEAELAHFVGHRMDDLQPTKWGTTATVAGLILSSRVTKGPRGSRFIMLLDDRKGRIEVVVFSEQYDMYRDKLNKDSIVIVEGEISFDAYSGGLKMAARSIMTLADARAMRSKGLELVLEGANEPATLGQDLQRLLRPFCQQEGGCPVRVRYLNSEASVALRLGSGWRVQATDQLLKNLRHQFGKQSVNILY